MTKKAVFCAVSKAWNSSEKGRGRLWREDMVSQANIIPDLTKL